jgi:hypothetical protein
MRRHWRKKYFNTKIIHPKRTPIKFGSEKSGLTLIKKLHSEATKSIMSEVITQWNCDVDVVS